MRVLIYSYGTRGDVQPYLALAYALHRRGHQATLAAPARFEAMVRTYGVDFHPRDESFLTFINEDAEVRRLGFAVSGQGGRNSIAAQLRVFRRYRALLRDWYPRQLDDLWRAAGGGADVVVTSPLMSDPGVHVAERLGAHPVLAPLIPNYVPSWTYPSLQLRLGTRLPRPLNRLSHLLPTNSQPRKRDIRRWRVRTLALPPHPARWNRLRRPDGKPVTVVHCFSPVVVPPAPEWPEWVHTPGFWSLPAPPGWRPPDDVAAFVERSPEIVYVGFSSAIGADPRSVGEMVVAATRRAGVRAVVTSGWGGIDVSQPARHVMPLREIPHGWLFPRMRAIVHAGGAGTTNAALAAGVPQVTCPFHGEQEMWGLRMAELGVASAPIRQCDLTVDRLATAIRTAVADRRQRQRAERLGRLVRAEDGADGAVRIIEQVAWRDLAHREESRR